MLLIKEHSNYSDIKLAVKIDILNCKKGLLVSKSM